MSVRDEVDAARQVLEHSDAELADAERLLEVVHVAKRLRCHPETVRRHIRAGHLKAVRRGSSSAGRGGNYLIPESAVREFLATSHHITQHARH